MGILTRIKQLAGRFRSTSHRAKDSSEKQTSNYESFSHEYFQQPRDLPLFSWWTVQQMMYEGEIIRSLAVRAAPLIGVEFAYRENDETERGFSWKPGAKCDRPEVKEYIDRQLEVIRMHMHGLVDAQRDGWAAGEVTLCLNPDTNQVEIDKLHPLSYVDCRLILVDGEAAGVRVRRVKDKGDVDLMFPYGYLTNHKKKPGRRYGSSVLIGAYSPWHDKWSHGGALDIRRLFMHKDAYGGMKLGYPGGETYDELLDKDVPNRDIARQIAEQRAAGGVIVYPSTYDSQGNPEWPIDEANVASNPTHILDYPKDLDAEMRTGLGITDGVIDNDNSSGLGDTRSIAMQAFYASLDGWMIEMLGDMVTQVLEKLVKLNWGYDVMFSVSHKPFAEQAMENQNATKEQNSNGGFPGDPQQQGFGNQPPQDGDGFDGGGQGPNDPQVGPPRTPDGKIDPTQMSLAVGEGVLSAAEMIKAAREAIRMGLSDASMKSIESIRGKFPTAKQREAGNCQMGHASWHGLSLTIETLAGESRSPEWPPLKNHYGYIKRTEGADGDHVDIFVGPNMDSETVAVVDQCDESGCFDEHKVILGVSTIEQAKATYLSNYQKGWNVGPISLMSVGDFKQWLKNGDTTEPIIKMSAIHAPVGGATATDSDESKAVVADAMAQVEGLGFSNKSDQVIAGRVSKEASANPKDFIEEVFVSILEGLTYDDEVMRLFASYVGSQFMPQFDTSEAE